MSRRWKNARRSVQIPMRKGNVSELSSVQKVISIQAAIITSRASLGLILILLEQPFVDAFAILHDRDCVLAVEFNYSTAFEIVICANAADEAIVHCNCLIGLDVSEVAEHRFHSFPLRIILWPPAKDTSRDPPD